MQACGTSCWAITSGSWWHGCAGSRNNRPSQVQRRGVGIKFTVFSAEQALCTAAMAVHKLCGEGWPRGLERQTRVFSSQIALLLHVLLPVQLLTETCASTSASCACPPTPPTRSPPPAYLYPRCCGLTSLRLAHGLPDSPPGARQGGVHLRTRLICLPSSRPCLISHCCWPPRCPAALEPARSTCPGMPMQPGPQPSPRPKVSGMPC